MKPTPSVTLVTPTFARDFERFLLQRESIERWQIDIPHVAVVNHESLELFQKIPFQKNLTLLSTRDVLPKPIEARRLAQRHSWKHPTYWLGPKPLHGWMIQQLIKLSAPAFVETEAVVSLDSDAFFVGQVTHADFYAPDGRVHLYETTDDCDVEIAEWLAASMHFLGVPTQHEPIRRHFHCPVLFHTGILKDMQEMIQVRHSMPWMDAMVKAWVSEGTYGVYARYIDGLKRTAPVQPELTVYYWWREQFETFTFDLVSRVKERNARIVLVNSNIGQPVSSYRSLVERAWQELDARD